MIWNARNLSFLLYLISFLWFLNSVLADLGDPYKILGVNKYASTKEIRKTYKRLAREIHPDKSDDPEAEVKFVEMKQAYELLSDPERRKKYDQKGITEDDSYIREDHKPFYANNPFDDLFGQGAHFNFQENDITFFYKLSVTARHFDKVIVPKSTRTPHLIFYYTDWCFPCLQMAPYCRKLVDYLEPLGVSFVTVHSGREPTLARKLSIHTIPCLVVLIEGNVYVYKDTITSVQKIIEFLRSKMPYNLVPTINADNVDQFLSGWKDNRVRGLIFEPRSPMRLRYLISAFHFRDRVAFGFVDSTAIRKKYRVRDDMDTVLLFNEDSSRPIASISMKEIPSSTLHNVVSSNQYLALPRLSSQEVLEAVCPCEWNTPRKRLCVVLVTEESSAYDPHRDTFRSYAQKSPYSTDRVRFAYIYHGKQTEFVSSLIPDGQNVEPLLSIVIIWRLDTSHIKYEWMTSKWEIEERLNDSTQQLENTISRLLRSTEVLSYEAFVKDLFDEHAKGLLGRIINKLIVFSSSIYDSLGKEQILPAISIVGTLIFIIAIGYFMAYLVRMEEESIKQQKAKNAAGNNNNNSGTSLNSYQPELKLHEMRSEKYNGLVRLLKPGCRTILLVLDMQSRQQLIPPFHRAVWPYRKNKTLMFSYMFIERGLSWYKELLELSLPEGRDLKINPRNCVGTVLSLNGHRKYFCMFHAKHTESKRSKGPRKSAKRLENRDCEAAAFIGFDSDSSESEDEVLLQSNLLDGLPNWLDRLFEGTTRRYHINYWPEFPNK